MYFDQRAENLGLSLAQLARRSGVAYHRIWGAAKLTPSEIGRIEEALAAAEQRKTAAGTTRAAVKEVAVAASEPRPEP